MTEIVISGTVLKIRFILRKIGTLAKKVNLLNCFAFNVKRINALNRKGLLRKSKILPFRVGHFSKGALRIRKPTGNHQLLSFEHKVAENYNTYHFPIKVPEI